MNIDQAKLMFDKLANDWKKSKEQIETEQDARFQIINRMLTEVLGWSFDEISTEPHVEDGYIDYLLRSAERNRFVVEAKRVSSMLIDTKNQNTASYKVSGPALKAANSALNQVQSYCLKSGVSFGAVTNGFEWIAHWCIRGDGRSPNEYQAIVFHSLDSINNDFAIFYDLFSKAGVMQSLFKIHINEAEGLHVDHSEPLYPARNKAEGRLLQKSRMAIDFEHIFREFFSSMAGENNPEMLAQCFVESKESQHADSSLEKIARNLLSQIEVVNTQDSTELQSHIRDAVEAERGEFVLIIGNKGAGKTTFIDRFFRLILDKGLRDQCIVLRIDLADSDGDISKISSWLKNKIKDTLEKEIFRNGSPTFEELQGVFWTEYTRWRDGEFKYLYIKDKDQFKIQFGEYLSSIIHNDTEKYLTSLLFHVVLARKQMPCIVLDNTDHFPQDFQEQVFQYAQSIYRNVFSFIICPITDRTIWQLSKSGPMQSYETTSFYLPIPSTKEVLRKRVDFIRSKVALAKDEKAEYFLKRGIKLSVSHIKAFAACIEEVFINTEFFSRTISWLANHDIRRSLQISQRILTSPQVSIEDLTKSYIANSPISLNERMVVQALVLGSYNYFNQDESEFILNLFSISSDGMTSPILKLSILQFFKDIDSNSDGPENSYISMSDVQNYFEPMGVSQRILWRHLQELLDYRLLEPYDPTNLEVVENLKARITFNGKIHYEFALNDNTYLTQVSLSTNIRQGPSLNQIKTLLLKPEKKTYEDWREMRSTFVDYCLSQDKLFITIPTPTQYVGQRVLRQEFERKWLVTSARESIQ